MKTNMNQRKLSMLWSSLFAVMMMLVGSSAYAQEIQAFDANGLKVYEAASCNATTFQAAVNTVTTNGEVRLLTTNCELVTVGSPTPNNDLTTTVNISGTFKLTSGVGGSRLSIGGRTWTNGGTQNETQTLNINSGTVTLGTNTNNIDISVWSPTSSSATGGTLNIASTGSLVFQSAGNTLSVGTGATLNNNGNINSSVSPRTAGTVDILGTAIWTDIDAPAGVYYLGGTVQGTGTWGNMFFTGAVTLGGNATFKINSGSEVVIRDDLNLNGFALTLSNASGTNPDLFDVQHTDGDLSGTTASSVTVRGNFYTTGTAGTSTFDGDLTVYSDATFANTGNSYTFDSDNSITVVGDLSIANNSFGGSSSSYATVVVWGDVDIDDASFVPNLTMSNANTASGADNSSTLAGHTGTLVNNLAVTSTANGDETVTFSNSFTVGGTTTLSSHIVIPSGVTTDFSGTVSLASTSTLTKNGTGDVNFNNDVTNASGASITHSGSDDMNFGTGAGDNTGNSGTITLNGTGTMDFWELTNTATGVVRNSSASPLGTINTRDLINPNNGLIENSGAGEINIDDITTGGTTNAGTISNTGTGTLTIEVDIENLSAGTLKRTNGDFIIEGDLENSGKIEGAGAGNGPGDILAAYSAPVTGPLDPTYVNGIVNAARRDGIQVKGNFTQNNANGYAGNVIVDAITAPSGNRSVTGAAATVKVGFLTIRSGTPKVSLGKPLQVVGSLNGHLIIADGDLEMNGHKVTFDGAAGANVPPTGVYVGPNARWIAGSMEATGNRVAVGQVTAAQVNGPLVVTGGQVQLASNVWVASAAISNGATVKKELGSYCFDFNVSGSTTGVVLNCGVITITTANWGGATSIRDWLQDNNYNPDQVEGTIELALAPGTTVNLTDAAAEGFPGAAVTYSNGNWKGVTLTNTQRNFILSSGNIVLNDANLTLFGGFTYSGAVNVVNSITSTATVGTGIATAAVAATRGHLVFTNNTIGGTVPQANFSFVRDGVNNLNNNFTIQRMTINRTEGNTLQVIDGAANPGVPSAIVITERFVVNNNTNFNINDNDVRYIGGTTGTDSNPLARGIVINTNNMSGTGYLHLANNHIGASDANNVSITGTGTNLKTQFKQTGSAGGRSLASSAANSFAGSFTQFGNNGISFVSDGSLSLGNVNTVNDQFFYVSGNSMVTGASVTFNGSLNMTNNDNSFSSVTSRLVLTGNNIVKGNLTLHNLGVTGSGSTASPNALVLSGGTGLSVEGDVSFLGAQAAEPVSIARPARLTIGGSATTPATIRLNGSAGRYVQRMQINRPGGAQFNNGVAATLYVNDLLLTDGTFFTGGKVAMYDLANPAAGNLLGGAADPNFAVNNNSLSGFEALGNLSIVTRDRSGTKHGQISRNSNNGNPAGPFGAYSSAAYNAAGGAPYTVQHIGSTSRYSGDEIPGLVVVNGQASGVAFATNSTLNRLVIDLASNDVEFELSKDLMINNRLETLTGKLDIAQSAFLDLEHDMQWVVGHMVPSTDLLTASVIRFPNTTGNTRTTTTTSLANGRYDLLYVTKLSDVTTGYEFKSGVGVRDLTIITGGSSTQPRVVSLNEDKELSGSLRVVSGTLNLNSKRIKVAGNLAVDAKYNGNDAAMGVNANGNARVSGWFPVRVSAETSASGTSLNPYNYGTGTLDDGYGNVDHTNGTIEFVGTGASYALGYVQASTGSTTAGRGPVNYVKLPNIEVTKTGSGKLTFDIDQAFTIGFDQSDINKFEVLSFKQNSGRTDLRPGYVNGFANLQSDAPLSGAQTEEKGITTTTKIQRWEVVGNMTVTTGDFYAWGATMTVGGNYTQGVTSPTVRSVFYAGQNDGRTAANADDHDGNETELNFQVNGNFFVLNDKDADATPNLSDVNITVAGTLNTEVNRFYLSYGTLKVRGDYSFLGHGDITSGINVPYFERGLRGLVVFNGTGKQLVAMSQLYGSQPEAYKLQTGRAFFNNVQVANTGANGGIVLEANNHMYVNHMGTLDLTVGDVETGMNELVLFNPNYERWDVNFLRPALERPSAIINSGSNSFVIGNLRRFVEFGYTTGGAQGPKNAYGYAFPLGYREGTMDYYRPLTFSFPRNLGETISVVASSDMKETSTTIINPAITVAGVKGNIRLNKTTEANWNVQFEKRPALEPNVRVGAQGIISNPVADVDDMRIVARRNATSAWSMFGVYDLTQGTNPDDSYNPNDWIDGIPTFFQEGVNFFAQSQNGPYTAEVRIATNDPLNAFTGSGTVAFLQVIHNSPAGSVDVLVNDALFLDNFAYQTATSFTPVVADTPLNIALKTANGATELLTINGAVLESGKRYILIAQGGADGKAFEVKVVDYARSTSTLSEAMQFFFSHGVTNGPAVNVERVTTTTPRTLEQLIAVNAAYGSAGNYLTQLNPGITTLQLKAGSSVVGQYLFDFGAYAGKSMTLLATGRVGGTGANALSLIGVDAEGKVIRGMPTLSDEKDAQLPSEFTVHGNYPNPFNPTTNVRFDLPEQANVRIEVVDVLGRQVMTVAPQTMSAGANKVITIDAARLSSGTYFYRVVAEGATRTFIQGSKFTLVK